MFKSGVIRSLTFKANEYADNISTNQAIENSAAWEEPEQDDPDDNYSFLDNLPTAIWDDTGPATPAGSSTSHASTPETGGRAGGRGRAGRGGRARGQ